MIVKHFIATKGFIRYDGKILLVRESNAYVDGVNVGKYDVPGGRNNPDESQLNGLNREIFEESGLKIHNPQKFFSDDIIISKPGEEWHINRNYYICDTENDNVTLSVDHDHFIWIDPHYFGEIPLVQNLPAVFEAYLKLVS